MRERSIMPTRSRGISHRGGGPLRRPRRLATGEGRMHSGLLGALWLAWLAYWISAARTVKDARRQESSTSRAAHVVPLVLAGALLASSRLPVPWLQLRL